MTKENVESLTQALEHNLELVRMLSKRIESLESQVEENAAQRMAVMLLLRATVQCSPDQEQIASLVERMTAQMQAQPGILLHGGKSTLQRAKQHVDWMTAPGLDLG